jgi:hypothetical protein
VKKIDEVRSLKSTLSFSDRRIKMAENEIFALAALV